MPIMYRALTRDSITSELLDFIEELDAHHEEAEIYGESLIIVKCSADDFKKIEEFTSTENN